MPHPVLGSSLQETHGRAGVSPTNSHEDDDGLENLSYYKRLKELGMLGMEKPQGVTHQLCTNI